MSELNHLKLFHTNVFIGKIDGASKLSIPILELMQNTSSTFFSNRGGWHSPIYGSMDNDFMSATLGKIQSMMDEIYDLTDIDTNRALLDNYWFNVNSKFNFNKTHDHPFSYYSVCVYIKTPTNCGNIVFDRPDALNLTTRIKTSPLTDNNYKSFWTIPEEDTIIIFPSYLKHMVEPNLSNDDDPTRISIALNYR